MTQPTAKLYCSFDAKRCGELLKLMSLRTITDHCEVSQPVPQKRSSRTQSQITRLSGNQPSDKYQLELRNGLRRASIVGTNGGFDPVLRQKKQLVAMSGELRVRLGRSSYDRRCVTIGRFRKRQEAVELSQARDPFPLLFELAKAGGPRQPATNWSNYKRHRSFAEEEGKGTRQNRGYWHQTQYNIELPRKDATS